jgi:hypothetical protein
MDVPCTAPANGKRGRPHREAKRRLLRSSRGPVLGACLLALLLSACGTAQFRFRSFAPPPSADRHPLTLALVLPPAVCSYPYMTYHGQPMVFHIGPPICRSAEEAAKRTFRAVKVVMKPDDVAVEHADAVAALRITGANISSIKKIPARIMSRVTVEWSFRTRDGSGTYVRRLVGAGDDERVFGLSSPRLQDSMQRCLDDLGREIFHEMVVSVETGRKNVAAENDILAKLGSYKAGVTTLAKYEGDKTKDWHVTIKERGVAAKRSTDGKGGKTAITVKTEYLVREEVRSAYGDDLVCEIEFRGKSLDGIAYASSACRRTALPDTGR